MATDIQPWKIVLREETVPAPNLDALVEEALMPGRSYDDRPIDETKNLHLPEYPRLKAFVEDQLIPLIMQYACEQFAYEPLIDSWQAWVRNSSDGHGTPLHHHTGAHVSAIYYLEACEGYLTVCDPRGLASRGYPWDVINNHFQPYKHQPQTGGLLIFPSYLQHYVQEHAKGLRLAIPIDVYLKE
jgi:hypothetical protein